MSLSISNLNSDDVILDATIDKVNLTYISKFELPKSIPQYINLALIYYDVYIDNFIIALDAELNL